MKKVTEKIGEIKRSEKGAMVFVNVTGGTKLITMAALIAAYLTGSQPYYVQEKPLKVLQLPARPSTEELKFFTEIQQQMLIELGHGSKTSVDLP